MRSQAGPTGQSTPHTRLAGRAAENTYGNLRKAGALASWLRGISHGRAGGNPLPLGATARWPCGPRGAAIHPGLRRVCGFAEQGHHQLRRDPRPHHCGVPARARGLPRHGGVLLPLGYAAWGGGGHRGRRVVHASGGRGQGRRGRAPLSLPLRLAAHRHVALRHRHHCPVGCGCAGSLAHHLDHPQPHGHPHAARTQQARARHPRGPVRHGAH